jgi:hypothetical protein
MRWRRTREGDLVVKEEVTDADVDRRLRELTFAPREQPL